MVDAIASYYQQGGPVLVALIVLSVVALAVGLERFVAMWIFTKRMSDARLRILQHVGEGNLTMARAVNSTLPPHPGAKLFEMILAEEKTRPSQVRRLQQRLVRTSKTRMWILATVGATSPFIGLFGTVLGIMDAFRRISEVGSGGFQVVSGGISEALITTAAGIFVGIEAMVFYNYLQSQTSHFAAELKDSAEEIVEAMGGQLNEAERGDSRAAAHR